MNCVKGDLAVIVRSRAGLEGTIVKCVRLHSSETHDLNGVRMAHNLGPRWLIDAPLKSQYEDGEPVMIQTIADANLRPIRDNPGQDETLTWLDVPSKEIA